MLASILKTAFWPVTITAAFALSAGSFVSGYCVGYVEAWQDACEPGAISFRAAQWKQEHENDASQF